MGRDRPLSALRPAAAAVHDDAAADVAIVQASLEEPGRFGAIFERHHATIWRYLCRSAGRDSADELAGDVFTTAFRIRHTFDPSRGTVRAWLYGIAGNLLRTRQRSERRGALAVARSVALVDHRVEAAGALEDGLEAREDVEQVRHAVARLRRDDREILLLATWEELTYEEIAQVLDVPVGTVRSRLSRSKERLRQLLLESRGQRIGRSPSRAAIAPVEST